MYLATVAVNQNETAVAVIRLDNQSWLDIAAAAGIAGGSQPPALTVGTVQAVIEGGDEALKALLALKTQAETGGQYADATYASDSVRLLAPIPIPRKNVFCVGRNYAEHIAEFERAQKKNVGASENPIYFTKPLTAVIGPGAEIPIFAHVSEAIDYEVELTVVIGKPGRNIKKADAYDHVFGYTILNDISARDVQRAHGGQYFKGKALDGSCPLGPWIVTADEIGRPDNLSIGLSVNGEVRQNGNTSQMIFDIPTLIESLSAGLTLEPGDLIATGTPSGVGYAMEPPQFLKHGDTVVCEIEKIGQLPNTMRRESNS